jgi:hypothetical protein
MLFSFDVNPSHGKLSRRLEHAGTSVTNAAIAVAVITPIPRNRFEKP